MRARIYRACLGCWHQAGRHTLFSDALKSFCEPDGYEFTLRTRKCRFSRILGAVKNSSGGPSTKWQFWVRRGGTGPCIEWRRVLTPAPTSSDPPVLLIMGDRIHPAQVGISECSNCKNWYENEQVCGHSAIPQTCSFSYTRFYSCCETRKSQPERLALS